MPATIRPRLSRKRKKRPHDKQATIAHPKKPAARGLNLKTKKPKPRPTGDTKKLPKHRAPPVAKKHKARIPNQVPRMKLG
jgi:hypothetical protein